MDAVQGVKKTIWNLPSHSSPTPCETNPQLHAKQDGFEPSRASTSYHVYGSKVSKIDYSSIDADASEWDSVRAKHPQLELSGSKMHGESSVRAPVQQQQTEKPTKTKPTSPPKASLRSPTVACGSLASRKSSIPGFQQRSVDEQEVENKDWINEGSFHLPAEPSVAVNRLEVEGKRKGMTELDDNTIVVTGVKNESRGNFIQTIGAPSQRPFTSKSIDYSYRHGRRQALEKQVDMMLSLVKEETSPSISERKNPSTAAANNTTRQKHIRPSSAFGRTWHKELNILDKVQQSREGPRLRKGLRTLSAKRPQSAMQARKSTTTVENVVRPHSAIRHGTGGYYGSSQLNEQCESPGRTEELKGVDVGDLDIHDSCTLTDFSIDSHFSDNYPQQPTRTNDNSCTLGLSLSISPSKVPIEDHDSKVPDAARSLEEEEIAKNVNWREDESVFLYDDQLELSLKEASEPDKSPIDPALGLPHSLATKAEQSGENPESVILKDMALPSAKERTVTHTKKLTFSAKADNYREVSDARSSTHVPEQPPAPALPSRKDPVRGPHWKPSKKVNYDNPFMDNSPDKERRQLQKPRERRTATASPPLRDKQENMKPKQERLECTFVKPLTPARQQSATPLEARPPVNRLHSRFSTSENSRGKYLGQELRAKYLKRFYMMHPTRQRKDDEIHGLKTSFGSPNPFRRLSVGQELHGWKDNDDVPVLEPRESANSPGQNILLPSVPTPNSK